MGSENDLNKTTLSTPSSISDQTLHLTTFLLNIIFLFFKLYINHL